MIQRPAAVFCTIILAGMLFCQSAQATAQQGRFKAAFAGLQSEYFQESEASLTIEEISSPSWERAFKPNEEKHFSFGLSQSANWIRFRIGDVAADSITVPENLVLYFTYASFGDIRLYLPMAGEEEPPWIVMKGGIFQGLDRDDLGFVFPVFRIPAGVDKERDVYVRIQGPFTANFQLVLSTTDSFDPARLRIVLFLASLFGVMIAMVLYNLVLYFVLRDRNYIFYVLYLFLTIVYQGVIAGIIRIVSDSAADFLTVHVVVLSFLAMAGHLTFAWFFLGVPRVAPVMKNVFRFAWAACAVGILFSLSAKIYQANLVAYIMGGFLPVLLVVTVAISYRTGHWVSKYYLLAVAALMASVLIFVIRGFGIIEHSIYTSYSILTASALESLLFSFALADRFRKLQKANVNLQERERELSVISITDELTGLFNRRHFNSMLLHSMESAHASGQALSIMCLDIDHFKSVNDTHGHQVGDEVLKTLGRVMRNNVRVSDYACRVGGEEFAIIMHRTDAQGSRIVAERMRREFGEQLFQVAGGGSFSSTISIGLAEFIPGEKARHFVGRADRALYRAKSEGRNRTVTADDSQV